MIGWLGADGFDWLFFLLSFFFLSCPFIYTLLPHVLTTKILIGRFEHLDCYFRRRRCHRSSERATRQNKAGKEGERTKKKKEKEQNVRTVIQKYLGRLKFGYLYLHVLVGYLPDLTKNKQTDRQ